MGILDILRGKKPGDDQGEKMWLERGEKATSIGKKIEYFTRAIELRPDSLLAHLYRGAAYYRLGEYTKAVEDFTVIIGIDAYNTSAYVCRAAALSKLEIYDMAIKDYDQAVALNPDYAEAYYSRGITYDRLGEHEKAAVDLAKAMALNPALFGNESKAHPETYVCELCGTQFTISQLDRHYAKTAQQAMDILQGRATNGTGITDVQWTGAMNTFDDTGRAWCPLCVPNARSMPGPGRTVMKKR